MGKWLAGLILAVAWAGPAGAQAPVSPGVRNAQGKDGAAGRPTVFVHIQNQAAVPPEIVAGARDQLMHVYDHAGVHVESSVDVDHDRCGRPLTIHVIVLGGASADRFIKAEQVGRKVLAQANTIARRVYVFWERLGPAVDRQAVARGDALGLVIAHELGHVLLPGRGHSQDGLMQANYNAYLSYGLRFDLQQSAALRAFVTAAHSEFKR